MSGEWRRKGLEKCARKTEKPISIALAVAMVISGFVGIMSTENVKADTTPAWEVYSSYIDWGEEGGAEWSVWNPLPSQTGSTIAIVGEPYYVGNPAFFPLARVLAAEGWQMTDVDSDFKYEYVFDWYSPSVTSAYTWEDTSPLVLKDTPYYGDLIVESLKINFKSMPSDVDDLRDDYDYLIVMSYFYGYNGAENSDAALSEIKEEISSTFTYTEVKNNPYRAGMVYDERGKTIYLLGHAEGDATNGYYDLSAAQRGITSINHIIINPDKLGMDEKPDIPAPARISITNPNPPTAQELILRKERNNYNGYENFEVTFRDSYVIKPTVGTIGVSVLYFVDQGLEFYLQSQAIQTFYAYEENFKFNIEYLPDNDILFEDDFESGNLDTTHWITFTRGTSTLDVKVVDEQGSKRLKISVDTTDNWDDWHAGGAGVKILDAYRMDAYSVEFDLTSEGEPWAYGLIGGPWFFVRTMGATGVCGDNIYAVIPYIGGYYGEKSNELADTFRVLFVHTTDQNANYITMHDALGTGDYTSTITCDGNDILGTMSVQVLVYTPTNHDTLLNKVLNNEPIHVKIGVDGRIVSAYFDGTLAGIAKDTSDNPATHGTAAFGKGFGDLTIDNVTLTKGCIFNDRFDNSAFSNNMWSMAPAADCYVDTTDEVLIQDTTSTAQATVSEDFGTKDVIVESSFSFSDDKTGTSYASISLKQGTDYTYTLKVSKDDGTLALSCSPGNTVQKNYAFYLDDWYKARIVLNNTEKKIYAYLDGRLKLQLDIPGNSTSSITELTLESSNAKVCWDSIYVENVSLETTPPTVSISSLNEGATVTGIVNVKASVSDTGSGIDYAALYVDDTLVGIDDDCSGGVAEFEYDTSALPSGEYTFTVVVYDNAGNSNWDEVTVNVDHPDKGVFDTGLGRYPSISGTHEGTFTPKRNMIVDRMYTYPCPGTGGHTEKIEIYYDGTLLTSGTWAGYASGDYTYVEFPRVTLQKDVTYKYVITTGSYPQIHHVQTLTTPDGVITCTKFTDANGVVHNDWIPAIAFEDFPNGDFEFGGRWTITTNGSSGYQPSATITCTDDPGQGDYCAKLENTLRHVGSPRSAYITRTVTLPSDAYKLHYITSFWKDCWGASIGVRIKDSDGNVLAEINEASGYGGRRISSDWVERTIDVSAYAGQTVTIELFLEDLSTTWAGMNDHGAWFKADDFYIIPTGLNNPGFESISSWTTETVGGSYAPTVNLHSMNGPHSGSYCAKMINNFGGLGTPRAGYIRQTVTLPSTGTTLSYYVKYWKDYWGPGMGVRIKDSSGSVLAQNKEGTSGTPSSSDWVQRTINVSAYAGQTITIEIYLEDLSTTWAGNGDHGGWIAVDDFSVT